MNAFVMPDGSSVNSKYRDVLDRAKRITELNAAERRGREQGRRESDRKAREYKDEYRMLANALAGALFALDGGKLSTEMRKCLDGALERAQGIINARS